jgi:hypothetical protein
VRRWYRWCSLPASCTGKAVAAEEAVAVAEAVVAVAQAELAVAVQAAAE